MIHKGKLEFIQWGLPPYNLYFSGLEWNNKPWPRHGEWFGENWYCMNQNRNDHYDFICDSLSRHVQFSFLKSTKPLMFFWREIRFCFRLCRHFSPQCDSHGRSNQLTQSSATDSPGCSSIFNFLTRLWLFFITHILIWSFTYQDQWLKQRSNPTMHQWEWLEIP